MFVCICNAVSDQQIVDAVNAGARDIEDVKALLHVSTGCGSCLQTAEAIVENARLKSDATQNQRLGVNAIAALVYAA
jgi:bacterioferritin-associated ferredoxin